MLYTLLLNIGLLIGLWLVIVLLVGHALIAIFKIENPSTIVRVLYLLYSIAIFLYAMIYSPIAYLLKYGSPGFIMGVILVAIIAILLIVNMIIKRK